jgi:hypothetical protein
MPLPPQERDRIGLCASCKHVVVVRSDRSTVFYQCKQALTDPRFPKYPNLPVLNCSGYEDMNTPRGNQNTANETH